MIFYYDLRKVPLFHSAFETSGVHQQNQFRSVLAFYVINSRWIKRLPSSLFYQRPEFRDGDSTIIAFDSYSSPRFLRWLCRKEPGKRIILWCWNMIPDIKWLGRIPPQIEVWSYSLTDCRRYGLRYNTQFFFDSLAPEAEFCRRQSLSFPPKVLFIGREKGRADALGELAAELESAGAKVDLQISVSPAGRYGAVKEAFTPYEGVIEQVKDADVLLDYAVNPYSGLSLRSMEALFFGKKLITNNREILNADFYHPANIYVLGYDTRSLEEFFLGSTVPVSSEIRDRYLLSNWLKRFDEGGGLL